MPKITSDRLSVTLYIRLKDEKTGKPLKYQIFAKAGYKAPREVE